MELGLGRELPTDHIEKNSCNFIIFLSCSINSQTHYNNYIANLKAKKLLFFLFFSSRLPGDDDERKKEKGIIFFVFHIISQRYSDSNNVFFF